MKSRIEIAVELAQILKQGIPVEIIEQATAENEWFVPEEISCAVEAICKYMLKEQALKEWIGLYPTLPVSNPQNVLIVMAGNIPLVGFFDLLCVMMSGHRGYVKPASKDRALMEYVVSVINKIEPLIPIYIYNNEAADKIIATGSQSAVNHFRSSFANIPALLRGSRHSIAVISREDNVADITGDIYSYSGLGCRNVSMIFSPKSYPLNIPPTTTHLKYRNNYLQSRALLTMQGVDVEDNGASLFVKSRSFPSSLSTISVYEYESITEVEEWISENDSLIQCIVCAPSTLTHPRQVGFNESQCPTLLDYADGRDVMKFLSQHL